jgi:hypothetical protein
MLVGCAENDLAVKPQKENFPFRLVLDAEEGGDSPDAEDYGLEVAFADFIGDLPTETTTIDYVISNLTDDMIGAVTIDAVVYEIDDEEFELDFTASPNGLSGTITLNNPTTGEIPESFEIIFTLPGEEGTTFAEGSFTFSIQNLQTGNANVILGDQTEFTYEVVDHELAGSWELVLENAADLEAFQAVFASISANLADLSFDDVKEGEFIEVDIEFEFEEAAITITYINEEDEEVEIEIEGEYDFEDGELTLEGSHEIIGDDGEVEDELDFILEAGYSLDADEITITFLKVIDEDNFDAGEELFADEVAFTFKKD